MVNPKLRMQAQGNTSEGEQETLLAYGEEYPGNEGEVIDDDGQSDELDPNAEFEFNFKEVLQEQVPKYEFVQHTSDDNDYLNSQNYSHPALGDSVEEERKFSDEPDQRLQYFD